jgi:hypothetical protein
VYELVPRRSGAQSVMLTTTTGNRHRGLARKVNLSEKAGDQTQSLS